MPKQGIVAQQLQKSRCAIRALLPVRALFPCRLRCLCWPVLHSPITSTVRRCAAPSTSTAAGQEPPVDEEEVEEEAASRWSTIRPEMRTTSGKKSLQGAEGCARVGAYMGQAHSS